MYLAARAAHDLRGELREGNLTQSPHALLVGGTERGQLGLGQARARLDQLVDRLLPLPLRRRVLAAARRGVAARRVAARAPLVLLRAQRLVRLRRGSIPGEGGALEVLSVVGAELPLA